MRAAGDKPYGSLKAVLAAVSVVRFWLFISMLLVPAIRFL